jgi:hemerythrin-like domain-containing protein
MKPTQIMDAEHRLIESVVKALGGVADDMERGRHADVAMLVTAVEFLRVYADKLHHGKEETLFFPMLVKRGVPPQGCPIGGLNHEHEKGRALVRALAEQAPAYAQGRPGAKEGLLETLRGIFDLYQNHIGELDESIIELFFRQGELEAQQIGHEKAGGQSKQVEDELHLPRQEADRNTYPTQGKKPPSTALRRAGG